MPPFRLEPYARRPFLLTRAGTGRLVHPRPGVIRTGSVMCHFPFARPDGNKDRERYPAVTVVRDEDLSAVLFNDLLRHGEPQTGSPCLRGEEGLEHLAGRFVVDPVARIGQPD